VLRDITRHGDAFWSLMEMSILEHEWHPIQQSPASHVSAI
jgi:hypothetical protein